ncbi:MAG: hypothetical protein AAF772_19980, partial [Acidobacteriota bacterium]
DPRPELDRAIVHLRIAARLRRGDAGDGGDVRLRMAQVARRRGMYLRDRAAYADALRDLDGALAHYRVVEAALSTPSERLQLDMGTSHWVHAELLHALGRPSDDSAQRARHHFTRAAALDPQGVFPLWGLANAYGHIALAAHDRGDDPLPWIQRGLDTADMLIRRGDHIPIADTTRLWLLHTGAGYRVARGRDPRPWLDEARQILARTASLRDRPREHAVIGLAIETVALRHGLREARPLDDVVARADAHVATLEAAADLEEVLQLTWLDYAAWRAILAVRQGDAASGRARLAARLMPWSGRDDDRVDARVVAARGLRDQLERGHDGDPNARFDHATARLPWLAPRTAAWRAALDDVSSPP